MIKELFSEIVTLVIHPNMYTLPHTHKKREEVAKNTNQYPQTHGLHISH